jgi:hypothetical protein
VLLRGFPVGIKKARGLDGLGLLGCSYGYGFVFVLYVFYVVIK